MGKAASSSAKHLILANVYAKYDRCDQCDHEVSSTLEEEEYISAHAQRQDVHNTKLFVSLLQAAVVTPVFFSFIFFFFFLHHAYDNRGRSCNITRFIMPAAALSVPLIFRRKCKSVSNYVHIFRSTICIYF